jgi:hypothetical protein
MSLISRTTNFATASKQEEWECTTVRAWFCLSPKLQAQLSTRHHNSSVEQSSHSYLRPHLRAQRFLRQQQSDPTM